MRKNLLTSVLIILFAHVASAQNLLDLQGWSTGQGATNFFDKYGDNAENIREWGIGPHGNRVVLWKAVPDGGSNADGGWVSGTFNINSQMMYRYTVWIKKTNSNDGVTFFGCQNALSLSDNTFYNNVYFWYGKLPELDKWYLLVGYMHANNDPSTESYGGVYDGVTGKKVLNAVDCRFPADATTGYHRAYLHDNPNVNDRQYFYAPRVDLVNGNEPSIESLLGLGNASSNLSYFSGNVGIGTTTPQEKLSVNGKIRAKEIKVETANWPDYVFSKEYKLADLKETETFIKTNGHLPGVPSATVAEKEGIELGEMNKILLKKIEELTLHMIELKKENKQIHQEMKKLKTKLKH